MKRRAALVALLAMLGACSAGAPQATPAPLFVEVVNYDIVARRPSRLVVAAVTTDNRWAAVSDPRLALSPADESSGAFTVAGRSFALLGSEGGSVLVADNVELPSPGAWQVIITGTDAAGQAISGNAFFQVLGGATWPSIGDSIPAGSNVGPLADDRATMIVFAGDRGCASRYCVQVADMVANLAASYADRVAYVRIEPLAGDVPAPGASDWLTDPADDYHQPWTFLVDAGHRVIGSWDTIVTQQELEPVVRALPTAPPS